MDPVLRSKVGVEVDFGFVDKLEVGLYDDPLGTALQRSYSTAVSFSLRGYRGRVYL
jgi:hypothetical protein